MTVTTKKFLYPDWPALGHIRAAVTLVPSGLDLSLQNPERDAAEQRLIEELALPTPPTWLQQVHSNKVVWVEQPEKRMGLIAAQNVENNNTQNHQTLVRPQADACIAHRRNAVSTPHDNAALTHHGNAVCAVLTADCLPILLCDCAGRQIAAIHAGWRGQVAGIIEATVRAMTVPAKELLAWFGPAIGPAAYEVGADVYEKVMHMPDPIDVKLINTLIFQPKISQPNEFQPKALQKDPMSSHVSETHDPKNDEAKWLFNLYALASVKLQQLGVPANQIYGGELCTFTNPQLFYSYRRSKTTQRMASLIWFA